MKLRAFWPVLAALFLAALLFFHEQSLRFFHPVTPPPPAQQPEILQGVQPLEIVPVEYPRDLDFGKGKFALFDFSVPADSDLRLEKLVVSVDGATDAEMPQAWLRLNGVRIYTTAAFHNGEAVFTSFPPSEPGNIDIDSIPLGNITHERLQNAQESQILLKPLQPLPQLLPAGFTVSVGMYGKWSDGIASRPAASGIRFCLKKISGTMVHSGSSTKLIAGKLAETSFAQPICWPRLGIR